MFHINRAEKIIRREIDDLTIDRICFRRAEIENSIKWFYWQGTFTKRKYNKMNSLLMNKYSEIMNEWERKLTEETERNFQAKMKMYHSQHFDNGIS